MNLSLGTHTQASPAETIDTALRVKVWQAHGKLIHLAVWARPDLAHAVSVLGRYVHNPSVKLWEAYQRVCKYLVRTKDLHLVYGIVKACKVYYMVVVIPIGVAVWMIEDPLVPIFLFQRCWG